MKRKDQLVLPISSGVAFLGQELAGVCGRVAMPAPLIRQGEKLGAPTVWLTIWTFSRRF